MSEELNLSNEDQALEAQLAALSPAGGQRRDALLYQAGLRAGRRRQRRWQAATGALAAGLLLALVWPPMAGTPADRPGESIMVQDPGEAAPLPSDQSPSRPRVVLVPPPPRPAATTPPTDQGYRTVRAAVFQRGLAALESAPRARHAAEPMRAFGARGAAGGASRPNPVMQLFFPEG
jgi:hypothetical protein